MPIMKLRLHNYWASSSSHRVRIALALKGLGYEYVAVELVHGGGAQHAPAYHARNPMQQVPTLEVVEGDGVSRHVVQSMAIIELLDELYPEPAFLPADPFARAHARALAEIVNAGIQPHQNRTTQLEVRGLGGDGRAWARDHVRTGLLAFAELAAGSAGRYCLGDAPTIADCFLVPQMHAARNLEVPMDGLDLLVRIADEADRHPAFAAALPARQPDAPPA
jgi:maleylacetoacetate isomerase